MSSKANAKMEIVPLEEIDDLRKVWSDEAKDFTPWLCGDKPLSMLSECLGVGIISDPQNEVKGAATSNRRCDIVAKVKGSDDDGEDKFDTIVIENQLEKTDFSHLGRILLYAATHDAKYVVWIVNDATWDHRKAIAWLNENTNEDLNFYLVRVTAFKIAEGKVAPHFELVEGADIEKKVRTSGTQAQKSHLAFWSGFCEYAVEHGECFKEVRSFRKPLGQTWYGVSVGTSICHIDLIRNDHGNGRVAIRIYCDGGDTLAKLNCEFDKFFAGLNADNDAEKANTISDKLKNPYFALIGPYVGGDGAQKGYEWFARYLDRTIRFIRDTLGVK